MKRKTAKQWSHIIERWKRSGETAREFASREGVDFKQLGWWRWFLCRRRPDGVPESSGPSRALATTRGSTPSVVEFLPLHVKAESTSHCRTPPGNALEVVLTNGLVVRIPGAVDARHLSWVLAVADDLV